MPREGRARGLPAFQSRTSDSPPDKPVASNSGQSRIGSPPAQRFRPDGCQGGIGLFPCELNPRSPAAARVSSAPGRCQAQLPARRPVALPHRSGRPRRRTRTSRGSGAEDRLRPVGQLAPHRRLPHDRGRRRRRRGLQLRLVPLGGGVGGVQLLTDTSRQRLTQTGPTRGTDETRRRSPQPEARPGSRGTSTRERPAASHQTEASRPALRRRRD